MLKKRKQSLRSRFFNSAKKAINKVAPNRVVTAASSTSRFSRAPQISNNYAGIYSALNYPTEITYYDYDLLYKRQDIAQRIVKAPVEGCWIYPPNVVDSPEGETKFENELKEIIIRTEAYYNFYKADLLGRIGRYSVLYLGFDDTQQVTTSSEVNIGSELVYLTPIPEVNATISTWDNNIMSDRFGQPETYSINFFGGHGNQEQVTKLVHWSRIIHIAENTLESEIYGIPTLSSIYNRLLGIEKLAGGSPETYWLGARPGYIASAMPNSVVNASQLEAISAQLTDFSETFTRWMFMEGMDVKPLAPQVVSPKEHIEVQLQLISSATSMPVRMLTGSERGELASSQDERAWLKYVEGRRRRFCENKMLRPFIDRLVMYGAVSPPEDGAYEVDWEDLVVSSEKDKADIALVKARTISEFMNTPGADLVMPEDQFKKILLGMTEIEIEEAREALGTQQALDEE